MPDQILICSVCGTEWVETPGSNAPCDCGGELIECKARDQAARTLEYNLINLPE